MQYHNLAIKSRILTAISSNQVHRRVSTIARPRVVVVGAGWAGYRVALDIDKSKFDVSVVSPRNHFLFTPLLPSTAVGTLEFRAIQEPVRTIPGIRYFQASVDKIDFTKKLIDCTDTFSEGHKFKVDYDAIVLAPGSENNTFGVSGVENNPKVFFLKQLEHSRAIRNRLIECFEMASSPGTSPDDISKLLTFVVVGGGPTSIEFAAELYDFVKADVSRWYPDLYKHVKVVVVEASGHILNSFNASLVNYVEKLFTSRRVELVTGTAVNEVRGAKAILSNGREVDFGLLVWSTGVKQTKLIRDIPSELVEKTKNGRLIIDSHLRLLAKAEGSTEAKPLADGSAFALGDCACDSKVPLPLLAQVASQQGIYFAKQLNRHGLDKLAGETTEKIPPFNYHHLGSTASLGQWKGVYDSTNIEPSKVNRDLLQAPPLKGFLAFMLWRTAYWTKQVSVTNKILILMFWFKSAIFGRDISRF